MTVTVGVSEHREAVEFWVHNDGVIPKREQFQIFQRSFSTKGEGRGIGTYSVRMFTETYLGGEVTFVSSKYDGTTFSVWLPTAADHAMDPPSQTVSRTKN
jgi:sensor histidine kinase regulating citrate/malate metabolism